MNNSFDSPMDAVISEIWKHPCTAYSGLREKIRDKPEQMVTGRVTLENGIPGMRVDTTRKIFHWYIVGNSQ